MVVDHLGESGRVDCGVAAGAGDDVVAYESGADIPRQRNAAQPRTDDRIVVDMRERLLTAGLSADADAETVRHEGMPQRASVDDDVVPDRCLEWATALGDRWAFRSPIDDPMLCRRFDPVVVYFYGTGIILDSRVLGTLVRPLHVLPGPSYDIVMARIVAGPHGLGLDSFVPGILDQVVPDFDIAQRNVAIRVVR